MNLKRAIWMGALVYASSFIIGILIAVALEIDFSTATEAPPQVWYIGIVVTIVLSALFTLWYFKDKKIKPAPKEGLLFGFVIVILGSVFDAALIIPYLLLTDSPQDPITYYSNPLFWFTLLLIFATTTIVGWYKGNENKNLAFKKTKTLK
jgi:hypothetical protein